jgi:hypothetical protein
MKQGELPISSFPLNCIQRERERERTGKVAKVVECLLNKHEALSSKKKGLKERENRALFSHKKNKILAFSGKWMQLGIMLSRISQIQKCMYHMFSLICRM